MNLEKDSLVELAERRNKQALAVAAYMEHIFQNYKDFTSRDPNDSMGAAEQRIEGFKAGLRLIGGSTYIKIVAGSGVHSFIVREDGKKFRAGDVLKAASWAQPAKNFSRANIYDRTTWLQRITWDGAD